MMMINKKEILHLIRAYDTGIPYLISIFYISLLCLLTHAFQFDKMKTSKQSVNNEQ